MDRLLLQSVSVIPLVKGQTGATGTAGRGIASIHNFYLASAKKTGVTTSDAGWSSTTIPLTTATLPFLWQYQRITYTVGDPETTPLYSLECIQRMAKE